MEALGYDQLPKLDFFSDFSSLCQAQTLTVMYNRQTGDIVRQNSGLRYQKLVKGI